MSQLTPNTARAIDITVLTLIQSLWMMPDVKV